MSNKNKVIQEDSSGSIHVGFGNFVLRTRIIAVLESGSNPIKRVRERAENDNRLIDATAGRKTRSVLVTDSNHVILSALAPQTLNERLEPGATRFSSHADREMEEGEFVS